LIYFGLERVILIYFDLDAFACRQILDAAPSAAFLHFSHNFINATAFYESIHNGLMA